MTQVQISNYSTDCTNECDLLWFQFFVLLFILMLVELAMACVFLVYSREVGEFICSLYKNTFLEGYFCVDFIHMLPLNSLTSNGSDDSKFSL